MTVEGFEKALLAQRSLAAKEAWIRANAGKKISGSVARGDVERLNGHLVRGNRHEVAALALALAMLNANKLVDDLRRGGHLRASRVGFQVGTLRELVRLLMRLRTELELEGRLFEYLVSLDALYELGSEARRLRQQLLARLRNRRGTALKSFLVLANQAFSHGAIPHVSLSSPSGVLFPEEVASAVSRLIALYREEFGLRLQDFQFTDEQVVNKLNSTYYDDLSCALRLENLCRAETQIDGLPYRASVTDGGVVVRSIDPDVEKSVRLGYVQMELQILVRSQRLEAIWKEGDEVPASVLDIFSQYYEGILEKFVVVKDSPLRRITFGIPTSPELFKPLSDDRYFREELLFLIQLSVDDYEYEKLALEPFEVAPAISSIDLFKVNRLFGLIEYLFKKELEKVGDEKEKILLALHSVIIIMHRDQFVDLLSAVLKPDKARKIFELLLLDSSRDFVDLQYTPFLQVEDRILFAPALIAKSNLVRNIAFFNSLNKNRLVGADPMQAAVAKALRDAGFLVGEEVSDSKSSKTGDIDLIAYRDGVLYLFECKNAYHPCNSHEMRNSYDHIRKAGKQLTLRRDRFFSDAAYQAKIWSAMKWDFAPPSMIRTGVLIANRVFTGSQIDGHPVRQAHEFINVVSRGTIQGPEAAYRFWKEDALSTVDLDLYLSGDGLMADHFAAMKLLKYEHAFGAKSLTFESWYFDSEQQQAVVQSRYPQIVPSAVS